MAYVALGGSLSLLFSKAFLMKVVGPRLFDFLTEGFSSKVLVSLRSAFIGGQIAKLVLNLAGASDRNLAVASTGAYVSAGVAATLGVVFSQSFTSFAIFGWAPGPGWIVGAIAFVGTFVWQAFGHQKYSREVFTYKPGLWMPQSGGENCEKCNDLEYGCSEYQCKTFGAACNLINPDTENALCIWENKEDMSPPSLAPMIDSLLTDNYKYIQTQTGSKITYNGGCLPAFEGVTMGVQSDKPAQCRYDLERKKTFDEMVYATNFGVTAYLEEHRVAFSNSAFPSQFEINSLGYLQSLSFLKKNLTS